jgi:hypothetical protein
VVVDGLDVIRFSHLLISSRLVGGRARIEHWRRAVDVERSDVDSQLLE